MLQADSIAVMVNVSIQLVSFYLPWTPDWVLGCKLPGWVQAAGLAPVVALLAGVVLAPHWWVWADFWGGRCRLMGLVLAQHG